MARQTAATLDPCERMSAAYRVGLDLGRLGYLRPAHAEAGRSPLTPMQARFAAWNLPPADDDNPVQAAFRSGLLNGLYDRAEGR